MNKIIKGKQCTIAWHMDNLKLSRVDSTVVERMLNQLQDKYGNESPLPVTRSKVQEYLGMTLDYSCDGKVKFSMLDN